MLTFRHGYMMGRLADSGFMLLGLGLALYTNYYLIASLFGAKALLNIVNVIASYRRHRKLRMQLTEHLYRSDVHIKKR